MKDSRAANTDESKQYIEGKVHEIGSEIDLEGLRTEWEIPPDKTTGTYKLRVFDPEHTDPVVIPLSAKSLRWKTYYPGPEEDVEGFLKDEKELQPDSYNRKEQWDKQIRQALQGFCKSNNPIGFRS